MDNASFGELSSDFPPHRAAGSSHRYPEGHPPDTRLRPRGARKSSACGGGEPFSASGGWEPDGWLSGI